MEKKITAALISVFYKDGLDKIAQALNDKNITIYSTGGTRDYITNLGIDCIPVEDITGFPSILGGRVKTLHPKVFGGILGRRSLTEDIKEMEKYEIPDINLVVVDLYPFEETLRTTQEEKKIIEKIDIGGPTMIRAAAKNYNDVLVVADKNDYQKLTTLITQNNAISTLETRRQFAAKAFEVAMNYDIAINNYFNEPILHPLVHKTPLRYGENPHQKAAFYGHLEELWVQLHGKEISYNNLVDIDAALHLMADFDSKRNVFAIIKHTNVCGLAIGNSVVDSWNKALSGDPESAFGGVLISNQTIDEETANSINDLFFEILIANDFTDSALQILQKKKNRILIQLKSIHQIEISFKSLLNGTLTQVTDSATEQKWDVVCQSDNYTAEVERDLKFANIAVKHLKSNAIALVKNETLLGKGCGQTSRIDALKQSIEKAAQFNVDLHGAVMSSDAFFPFDDCVKMAKEAGISAVIQPGGSIRDGDSITYCSENNMTMVLTHTRHFKH